MDVRIGVTYSPKELELELADDADAAALKADLETGIAKGGVVWLTDRKGRQVGIPSDKIAYLEIGSPEDDRRIGFGA